MHPFEFVLRFNRGVVLDVGCMDGRQWKYPIPTETVTRPLPITDMILVDMDKWRNEFEFKFVRCLGENLPFKNQSVDSVVFGDILEHVKDPNILLKEGKRLTRDRIVISVPNEYKYNAIHQPFQTKEKHIKNGENIQELILNQTTKHVSNMCIDAIDDNKLEHIFHKRFFNEETFEKLIKDNFEKDKWEWQLYNLKYNFCNFYNLGAIICKIK